MGLCDGCEKKRNGDCKGNEPWEVIVSCGAYKRPYTNGDRIRDSSDEELAKWLKDIGMQCPEGHFVGDYDCINGGCESCWLDWLKSPVEATE